ncbi:RHS repeat-associated core domain-containing protein [Lacinutrix chionoecetis]
MCLQQKDYYPFGMLLPNRHKASSSYRYGFQGQEKDDEIKGEGNSINYKFRMHDPRVGRFFAVDPLERSYPFQSPYVFAGNNPILYIDYLGLGPGDPVKHTVKKGDNLTEISKKYGVTIDDLIALNDIEDRDLILIGQVLSVNPEANFSKNPRGGYRNANNPDGVEVEKDYIIMVGIDFAIGAEEENSMIVGGGALESVKNWKEVDDRVTSGILELKSGEMFPGKSVTRSFQAGSLASNMKKGLNEAWEKIKKWENPLEDNSQNSPIHILGSFNMSIRINANGTSATVTVYDSKTLKSGLDNQSEKAKNRPRGVNDDLGDILTNTYQRYIWNIDL